MKKYLWVAPLVLSLPLMANDYQAQVKDLNLNYNSPSGTASSQTLIYEDHLYDSFTQYKVELQAGVLMLETPDEVIQLEDLPDSISEVESLNISGLNLTSNQTNLALNFSKLNSRSLTSSMDVERLSVNCNYQSSNDTFKTDVLHSCLNVKGDISLDSYSADGKEVVGSTDISTRGNSMDFQLRAQGLKIKGNGNTYFENNQIRIKITKAKVGFLNVRGRLFKELEKLESDKISVNEPWIEIDL